jgi:NAD(P)-dependent dehydrogenase (short-subunit alcohol dehydrogenase family)
VSLAGKVALVAGGTSGIGRAIAESLAGEGAMVVICGTREEAVREIESGASAKTGGSIRARVCDVTDRTAVAELLDWVASEMGTVDILVNSAGTNVSNRSMANLDPEEFDRVMAVNFTGTFNTTHAALPAMREKGDGLIVNIISLAGKRVMELAGAGYCISKFAAGALGTYVNLEDAKNGIRVTNVYPGETNTPLVDRRPTPPPPEKRAQMVQPEDVAAMVLAVAKLPPRAVVPEIVITPPHMMVG